MPPGAAADSTGNDVPLEALVSRTLTTVCIALLALFAFVYPALGSVLR